MPPPTLRLLPGTYAICALAAGADVPAVPAGAALWSLTRTADETSLVCPAADTPDGARVEPGWSALAVDGPLDFALTGVLAGLTAPLAAAGVSVFVVSTYDTDVVLMRTRELDRAVGALRAAGHVVRAG